MRNRTRKGNKVAVVGEVSASSRLTARNVKFLTPKRQQRIWESDAPPEEPVKKPLRKGQDYPQHVVSEANLSHMFVKLEE